MKASSLALAGLSIAACFDDPTSARAQASPPRRATVQVIGSDTFTVSYVCGKTFRVTSTRTTATSFFWSTPGRVGGVGLPGPDVGFGTIPERLFGQSSAETFVTTRVDSTIRVRPSLSPVTDIFEMNGHTANCTPQRDTSWAYGANADDYVAMVDRSAKLTAGDPADSIYAHAAIVTPKSGRSRAQIANALATHSARVVAELALGKLLVRMDPTYATYSAAIAAVDSIGADTTFSASRVILIREGSLELSSRFPVESGNFTRAKWISRDAGLWPYLSSRLDLAWSCENGRYGSAAPRIVFFEGAPITSHADLDAASIDTIVLVKTRIDTSQKLLSGTARFDTLTEHALAVAGIAVAKADNGAGIPGIVWGGKATVVSRAVNYNSQYYSGSMVDLGYQLSAIQAIAPRILHLASFQGFAGGVPASVQTQYVGDLKQGYQNILDAVPGLVLVVTSANDYATSYATYSANTPGRFPFEHIALMELRRDAAYAGRVVVVTSVDASGGRPSFANYFSGIVDIAAPGTGLKLLRYPGSTFPDSGSGTSYSGPIVAATLALEFAMDPSLTATQAKALLLDGAALRKGRDASGNIITAATLSGTGVFPIDVYGTLMLTSARKAGLPVCGAVAHEANGVYFMHFSTGSEHLGPAMPGIRLTATTLSIAPGGRKLSLNAVDSITLNAPVNYTATLASGAWTVTLTSTVSHKVYLAEDTAFVSYAGGVVYGMPSVSLMQDSVSRRVSNVDATGFYSTTGANLVGVLDFSISPTGDWAISDVFVPIPGATGCITYTWHQRWVSLRGGHAPVQIGSDPVQACAAVTDSLSTPNWIGGVAWSDNGDSAIVASQSNRPLLAMQKWALGTSPTAVGARLTVSSRVDDLMYGMTNKIGMGEFRALLVDSVANAVPTCGNWQDRSHKAPNVVLATVTYTSGTCYFRQGSALRALSQLRGKWAPTSARFESPAARHFRGFRSRSTK